MFPYYLLFGTFALGALGERGDNRKGRSVIFFWVAAIFMTVMVGLRYHVGVDWTNYLAIWTYAGQTDLEGLFTAYHNSDPVFYALVWFLRNYGFGYWVLNLFCASCFTWGLFTFANRQPNRWLAVAVAVPYLVIVIAMSGVRQATAIGFVFLALVAFADRKPAKFLFFIACGAAFHASAVLAIPLTGMSFTKNKFQSALLLLVAALVGYFLLRDAFAEYANDYITNQAGTAESSGTLYRIAMNALPALIFFRYGKYIQLEPQDRTLWRNFALLAVGSIVLYPFLPSSTALDRVLLYLYPMQMFVLSRTPNLLTGEERRPSTLFITILILTYLVSLLIVFMSFGVNSAAYNPYRFYPLESDTIGAYQ